VANPEVVVDFLANTAQLKQATGEIGAESSRAGRAAKKAFVPAVAVLGAITAGAVKAVDAASALNEQISASNIVFGKQAKSVQAWAKTGAEAFGLSQTEALKAANAYGNMFATVGLGQKDITNMSKNMVQLAGDMASFHDQDPTEMLQNLRSGLSGEAEPLRKFGILISDASVKTFAYTNGIAKAGAELTEAQKVQARYGLIMEQSTKAQGDFARTSDSVANQQRTLAAQNENTAATFGKVLLPVTQELMKVLSRLIGWLEQYHGALQVLIAVVAALAITIIGVNVAMKAWMAIQILARAATVAWTAVQWLLNAALAANPIGLVVIAIAALVAAFILAWKHSETFRRIVTGAFDAVADAAKAAFNWIKHNWPLLLAVLTGPFGLAVVAIIRHWDRIVDGARAAVNAIKNLFGNLADFLGNFVDRVANIAERIANAIKSPINAVIGAWNDLAFRIPRVELPEVKVLGKKIGGGGFGPYTFDFPDIRKLQRGGIVTGPTLALLGEAGPEAVVPLQGGGPGAFDVRVYIGEQELRGLVRSEIRDENNRTAQVLLARRM
jgi:hypothetical protein